MGFKKLSQAIDPDEKLTIPQMTTLLKQGEIPEVADNRASGYFEGTLISPEIVSSLRDYAFYNSELGVVTFRPSKAIRIGKYAFAGCNMQWDMHHYNSQDVPFAGPEEVDDYAFYNTKRSNSDSGLSFFNNARSPLKRIGVSAFENSGFFYIGLSNANLLERIESRAFANAARLINVQLGPASDYIAPDIFTGCTRLISVQLAFSTSSPSATNYPWGADTSITKFTWSYGYA